MSKESALAMAVNPNQAITTPPNTTPAPPQVEKTTTEGQAGVVQAPTEVKPPELDSSKITHLIKKETELVKQRDELKKERDSFNSEKEKLKEIQAKLAQFEELRKTDPLKALKLLEFNEADLINFMASGTEMTPEEKATQATNQALEKFRKEQEARDAENQKKRNELILNNFRSDIKNYVGKDPDTYEFINHHGEAANELIYDTVSTVLQDTGEVISIKEAADMVEAYFEDSYKTLSQLKKVKPKTDATQTPPETGTPMASDQKKDSIINPTPTKTLNNKTVATTASTTVYKKETPSEKKERLIRKYLKTP